MADRPLYNGSARVETNNNSPGVENAYNFRVSTAAINTGVRTIANAVFEAEAGVAIVLNYDIRKFGSGPNVGAPSFAVIRIFNDDDSQNARTGAVAASADLIGGSALPRTGTFNFTPTRAGTYRIQLEMQNGNGNFGATSSEWRVISDGSFQRGGIANQTQATAQDKGRLRYGLQMTAYEVTKQDGSAAPAKFAFTMNAAATAAEEAVRETATQSHEQNKTTTREIYVFSARRNGTSTIDDADNSVLLGTTQHRLTRTVHQLSFPNAGVDQSYDWVATIENLSALHTGNTRQYDGLGGQAADGVWTYFTGATAPLSLIDYKTVDNSAVYNADAGGSIENVHCSFSSTYAEDGSGIPTSTEKVDWVATDENMTVKTGRVLNSRAEVLEGIYVAHQINHEDSGVSRDSWGIDDANFRTLANGWQDDAHVVTVATPPSGTHSVRAEGYFPPGSLSTPASREFYALRLEAGTPAGISAGKNWIAPASFSNGILIIQQVPFGNGAVAIQFTIKLYNKDVEIDADALPLCRVYKNYATTEFSTPVLVKRAATVGVYDGEFIPDAPSGTDVYEIAITATIQGFTRRYGDAIEVFPFDLSVDRFDPTGLFK